MLKKLLEENRIIFEGGFNSWQEALSAGAKPLVEQGKITEKYIQDMIDSVNEHGPYIVIAPNIAMPHSQMGSNSVKDTAISLMLVENAVSFVEGDPTKDARIFVTLAAVDNEKHFENMMAVSETLSNEDLVNDLLAAKNLKDIEAIISKY